MEQLKGDQIAQSIRAAEEEIAAIKDPAQRSEAERMLASLREVQATLKLG